MCFRPLSQPAFGQGSPKGQYNNAFAFQLPPPPPPWASELFEDIKQIKLKIQNVETIEKLEKSIYTKISDLETKMKMDVRVTQPEKSCDFQSSENENNKKDLKTAKDDIKRLQKDCDVRKSRRIVSYHGTRKD